MVAALPTQPLLVIPEQLMTRCPALPQPASGGLDKLLANHVQVAGQYHLCKRNHDDLVDVVRGHQDRAAGR